MPLSIELPDAAMKLRMKYKWDFQAQQTFQKIASLGNFNSTGVLAHDQFTSVLDGDPVVKTFDNFVINENHIVTVTQRCKGLYLFIDGDLTINGILSMTARGANAPGKFVGIDYFNGFIYFNDLNIFEEHGLPTVVKNGGLGASAVQTYTSGDDKHQALPGLDGESIEDGLGGGGSGASRSSHGGTCKSGAGAQATSFSGGPGGGAACCLDSGGTAPVAGANGGPGGAGKVFGTQNYYTRSSGGGAGNPGGTKYVTVPGGSDTRGWAYNGQPGTGGLILLFVKGNILFGPNGKIESKGSNGGDAGYNGGGGSGGGCIKLFTPNDFTDFTKLDVSGGLGGTGLSPGGKGGAGSKKIYNVRLM